MINSKESLKSVHTLFEQFFREFHDQLSSNQPDVAKEVIFVFYNKLILEILEHLDYDQRVKIIDSALQRSFQKIPLKYHINSAKKSGNLEPKIEP